jgi:hypothetical protein
MRDLVRAPLRRASGGPADAGRSVAHRIAGLPDAERMRALVDLVRARVSAVLGLGPADSVDPRRTFREIGFTSLTAVELRNSLVAATGVQLPAALVFDHPTPTAIAEHLEQKILQGVGGVRLPVLAQLDQLEAELGGAAPDDRLRAQVVTRLRNLAIAWDRKDVADGDVPGRLDAASDDEIFEFINTELGRATTGSDS